MASVRRLTVGDFRRKHFAQISSANGIGNLVRRIPDHRRPALGVEILLALPRPLHKTKLGQRLRRLKVMLLGKSKGRSQKQNGSYRFHKGNLPNHRQKTGTPREESASKIERV